MGIEPVDEVGMGGADGFGHEHGHVALHRHRIAEGQLPVSLLAETKTRE